MCIWPVYVHLVCIYVCVCGTTFQLNYKGPYDSRRIGFPEFNTSPTSLIKHDPNIPRWEYQAQSGKLIIVTIAETAGDKRCVRFHSWLFLTEIDKERKEERAMRLMRSLGGREEWE